MRVRFICGYYSDRAHNKRRRPERYWDAYFFVWAVKTGFFRREFNIRFRNGRIERITAEKRGRPRQVFGSWLVTQVPIFGDSQAKLVPVPSKDALIGATDSRSLSMVKEAVRGIDWEASVLDALRWTETLSEAHKGGARGRNALL